MKREKQQHINKQKKYVKADKILLDKKKSQKKNFKNARKYFFISFLFKFFISLADKKKV